MCIAGSTASATSNALARRDALIRAAFDLTASVVGTQGDGAAAGRPCVSLLSNFNCRRIVDEAGGTSAEYETVDIALALPMCAEVRKAYRKCCIFV
jgi:hypothetical protein